MAYLVRNKLDGKRACAISKITPNGTKIAISLHLFLHHNGAVEHAKLLNAHTSGKPWYAEFVEV
jgi:hypothetical protein